jgi:hypothetical protein
MYFLLNSLLLGGQGGLRDERRLLSSGRWRNRAVFVGPQEQVRFSCYFLLNEQYISYIGTVTNSIFVLFYGANRGRSPLCPAERVSMA